MKILGGSKRGRNFYMPAGIRPTQNLTRKAIFDIIGHDQEGCEMLELFAGSGGVGFEALSMGARKVTFVEINPLCYSVIQENAQILGFKSLDLPSDQIELINGDAFAVIKQMARQGRKFDLVFVDPPYTEDLLKKVLKTLSAHDIFKPNSFLIVEHRKDENLPELEGRFLLLTHRKYGISSLAVFQTNA